MYMASCSCSTPKHHLDLMLPYHQEAQKEDQQNDYLDDDDHSSAESSDSSHHELPQTPRAPNDNEKQISIDPRSLKQLETMGGQHHAPPPIPPAPGKPKFISTSLPSSTTSSPQSGSALTNTFKKCQAPTRDVSHSLARQGSSELSRLRHRHTADLRRSKSCGEGRACPPSDEFDILSRNDGVQVIYDCTLNTDISGPSEKLESNKEEGFKCGALCLFLPGFSKKKQPQSEHDQKQSDEGLGSRVVSLQNISRLASLERFECGSWSESAILDGDEDGGGVQSYFDLPLELIQWGANDADSPVKAAFVFERDRKGVLKKSNSKTGARKSHESSINRHVRFSTTAPTSYPPSPSSTCITPRLMKAREEFNALLEAQGV